MCRTYFRSGPLLDRASSGSHVTDVTSGEKTPLGRTLRNFRLRMRNFRLRMRRTYFRIGLQSRSSDWRYFRSRHFWSWSTTRSTTHNNWAVPIYYLLLNVAGLAKKQQIYDFIVFDLTQPGLQPTVYHNPGENAK
jgi:hypothetical protein